MHKVKDHNFYKWSVDKGDYKRDDEATTSYLVKKKRARRIKTSLLILLYLSGVSIIAYLIFGKF